MNLSRLDWSIVVLLILCLIGLTVYFKRYTRSVADFLAANRLAGRYLLTVSSGITGAVGLIAIWEMIYNGGLPTQWWGMMSIPLALLISLTGFVIYRYRQTRALTLAQFFEVRYSRKFRFFAGFLCWTSGILNYGIFPAVTARFILYFFGLPHHFELFGITVSTFPVIMLTYLAVAVYIACAGGQISIMITDFFQGMLLMVVFVVLMFFLLHQFSWSSLIDGLKQPEISSLIAAQAQAHPDVEVDVKALADSLPPRKYSMINPFRTSQANDFSIWYFLIGIIGAIYSVRAWQGNSGYNAAARTPHDAVMAGIIGSWRSFASTLCMLLIPISAYAVLNSSQFVELAAPVQAQLNDIIDPMIRSQMTAPLFMTHILPTGLLGLFAAVIIACAISCDDTYIHAWGTIFIQDVISPLRKKPMSPEKHMLALRCAIIGVAAFGFIFSMLFPLKEFILMYFALTGAIYVGGAGSVIIGGLYWKRGSTPAAWTALIIGTTIGFGGLVVQQLWPGFLIPQMLKLWPGSEWLLGHSEKFPINGQFIYLFTMLASIAGYILVSFLGPHHEHNMDKLLHRGKYAIEGDNPINTTRKFKISRLIGINQNFSKTDRLISYATFWWSMGWWGIFLVGTVLALTTDWITDSVWSEFWWWKVVPFAVILGTVCSAWIIIGGLRDAWRLFHDLRKVRPDDSDDGFIKPGKD